MNETNLTFWESSFGSFDKTKCLKCCSCSPWDYRKVSSTHSTGPVHFYPEIRDHKTIDYPSDCGTKETKVLKAKTEKRKKKKNLFAHLRVAGQTLQALQLHCYRLKRMLHSSWITRILLPSLQPRRQESDFHLIHLCELLVFLNPSH